MRNSKGKMPRKPPARPALVLASIKVMTSILLTTGVPLSACPTCTLCSGPARLTQDEGHRLGQDGLPVIILEEDMSRAREDHQLLGGRAKQVIDHARINC